MAGLKKARRLKEKQQYKTRDMTPQSRSALQQPAKPTVATPAPNPFVMGTATYGTPPKG